MDLRLGVYLLGTGSGATELLQVIGLITCAESNSVRYENSVC